MIYSYRHIQRDMRLSADVCVIGSGAGGSPVALAAAQAGLRVVVLEAGSFWTQKDFTQLEHEMFPRLYHQKAGRTTSDKAVQVHQGKGVGGSTLHNLNLCARVPDLVLEDWRQRFGLSALPPEVLDALYDEVEAFLPVSTLAAEDLRGSSLVLKRGCDALGYSGGFVRHNRMGCARSGFCELGCPFDAKQNALKVFMTPAVEAGAIVLTDTWATRIEHQGRRARRALATVRDPRDGRALQTITVEADAFCLSASATGTATLLSRSEIPDPQSLVGSRIHLHPGTGVAGIFEERLAGWSGIPQSYECTEFLDFEPESGRRIWIIPAFAHPAGVSAMLSGFGSEHRRYLERYAFMAALSPMIHDETTGTVRPNGDFDVTIDYWPNEADREQMRIGVVECARLLFAAGATKVVVPTARTIELERSSQLGDLDELEIVKHDLPLTSVHPMSSVWMGDDPLSSCVDSLGCYHHMDNVFVSDTSLFPTSIGAPPQLTTYALGLHVGRSLLQTIGA